MPRIGNLTFVASTTPTAVPEGITIPVEIRREAEEVYALLKTANGRIKVQYDTAEEASEFTKLMTIYCNTRPADVEIIRNLFRPDGAGYEGDPEMVAKITTGGPIKFRKSPVRGEKSDTIVQFRITDVQTKNEKETAEIREAQAKANSEAIRNTDLNGGNTATDKSPTPEGSAEPVKAAPAKATARSRK